MSMEKRLVLFLVLSVVLMVGTQTLLEALGLLPKPPKATAPEEEPAATKVVLKGPTGPLAFANTPDSPPAFATVNEAESPAPEIEPETPPEPEKPALAEAPEVVAKPIPRSKLVLGEADPRSKRGEGFQMRVGFEQRGAGVRSLTLAHHEAEFVRGQPRRQLELIEVQDDLPPSFALNLLLPDKKAPTADDEETSPADRSKSMIRLDERLWEVVTDAKGNVVTPVPADPKVGLAAGEQISFRTKVDELNLTVTKTFRLRRGADGFELILDFESPTTQTVSYILEGPHGIPIEGEWYTSTFREVFFGKIDDKRTQVETHLATEVVDQEQKKDPIRITTLPLKYAGVENQYFAVFLEPDPLPETPENRWDAETVARSVVITGEKQKSDVTVEVVSRPIEVGPRHPVTHSYKVFAGPKTAEALAAYGAEDLSTYRKGWQIWVIGPLASFLARTVISPMLDQIYALTAKVAGLFGGERGSYGIAIILLTITVRLILFPLSRKQVASAKKMQDLQPQLMALREKYKDDREKIGRETMELYRKHGVNPLGGCLPALIQLPIFIGLWQALNNSVALRHAPFLWIQNLAAPDQLLRFPFDVPFLGPYFNVLPILVIVLMMVQTKLFAPPATTAEQEMQQKMMKYMMVFMGFLFYRVPSGLGVYFITSSTWAICERLMLPKELRTRPAAAPDGSAPGSKAGDGMPSAESGGKSVVSAKGKGAGNGSGGGWADKLREKLEQVIDEASQDKTIRNVDKDKDQDSKRRPRPRPGKRR